MAEEKGQTGQKSIQELIKDIEIGAFNPRLLDNTLLDDCIEYLCFEQGVSYFATAHLLKRDRHLIERHAKKILKKRSEELHIRGIDVYELAQRLEWVTKLVMAQAVRNKDFRLYLDAFHKHVERLQSLGVTYKEPYHLRVGVDADNDHLAGPANKDPSTPESKMLAAKVFEILVDSGAFPFPVPLENGYDDNGNDGQ